MDDPTLQNRVLERSNVGMGMLVINRASLDLPCVNELYKRLRNLEVNSLKRFVGLAAMEPGPFSMGLDPKELLLAAVYAQKRGKEAQKHGKEAQKRGKLSRFSRALLWNSQELAYLVADYRKPLVCHLGGVAQDGGAALACLASFSGAYEDSEVCVRACRHGLVPMGGMTYVLASLPWHLGEFLALTGWSLRGYELVALDLVKHWLSPEALPFLELTSEKQLEVSEADAKLLLHEHSLPLPQDGDLFQTSNAQEATGEGFKRRYIPLINKIFKHESPLLIKEELKKEQKSAALRDYQFLKECLEGMDQACTKASWITLKLIKHARLRRGELQNRHRAVTERQIRAECLPESLRMELWAQQYLLEGEKASEDLPEIILRLHAACTHQEMPRQKDAVTLEQDIQKATEVPQDFVFAVPEDRSEISLSQHPRLRRYHPDYDPVTGLDHDPDWMRQEAERWDPNLFADERGKAVEELLGDRDPSAFGLSRWVRVESRNHAH